MDDAGPMKELRAMEDLPEDALDLANIYEAISQTTNQHLRLGKRNDHVIDESSEILLAIVHH